MVMNDLLCKSEDGAVHLGWIGRSIDYFLLLHAIVHLLAVLRSIAHAVLAGECLYVEVGHPGEAGDAVVAIEVRFFLRAVSDVRVLGLVGLALLLQFCDGDAVVDEVAAVEAGPQQAFGLLF